MTRRRDLFRHISIYAGCVILYLWLVLNVLHLNPPIPYWLFGTCIGGQTILLCISSYYVWRANIQKTKALPEHLLDFPDSMIYLIGLPTWILLGKSVLSIQDVASPFNIVVFVTAFLLLTVGLLSIAPILVEGIGLFLSSKYSKIHSP